MKNLAIVSIPEDQILDRLAADGVYITYAQLASLFNTCDVLCMSRTLESIHNLMYLAARGKVLSAHLPILKEMNNQLLENGVDENHPVIRNVVMHSLAQEMVMNPVELSNITMVVIQENWKTVVLRNTDINPTITHPAIMVSLKHLDGLTKLSK